MVKPALIKNAALCIKTSKEMCNCFRLDVMYPIHEDPGRSVVRVTGENDTEIILTKEEFKKHFQPVAFNRQSNIANTDGERWKEVMDLCTRYGFLAGAYAGKAVIMCATAMLEDGFDEYLRIQNLNGIDRHSQEYPFNGLQPGENSSIRHKPVKDGRMRFAMEESGRNVCPICGRHGLYYRGAPIRDGYLTKIWDCSGCGASGEEVNRLVFDGHYVTKWPKNIDADQKNKNEGVTYA